MDNGLTRHGVMRIGLPHDVGELAADGDGRRRRRSPTLSTMLSPITAPDTPTHAQHDEVFGPAGLFNVVTGRIRYSPVEFLHQAGQCRTLTRRRALSSNFHTVLVPGDAKPPIDGRAHDGLCVSFRRSACQPPAEIADGDLATALALHGAARATIAPTRSCLGVGSTTAETMPAALEKGPGSRQTYPRAVLQRAGSQRSGLSRASYHAASASPSSFTEIVGVGAYEKQLRHRLRIEQCLLKRCDYSACYPTGEVADCC